MTFRYYVCFALIITGEIFNVIAKNATDICGKSTPESKHPWLVGIEFDGSSVGYTVLLCTGALINRRHVVSNAECFTLHGTPKWVRFGPNITINGRACSSESIDDGCGHDGAHRVLIEAVITHPKYAGEVNSKKKNFYDIALIRLRDIIKYTNTIRPVCLPIADVTTTTDRDLYLAGVYSDVPPEYTQQYLGAAMSYLSREEYEKSGNILIMAKDQICASHVKEPELHACLVTGGLLVNKREDRHELVGLLGYITICFSDKLFTNFYTYVDWIKTVTPDWNPCGRRRVDDVELIVNGEETKAGDWPWHAAIFRMHKTKTSYICGGTLITKTIVLTAAHCATINGEPVPPNILTVVLGKYYLVGTTPETQEKEVEKVICHEHFAPRNHLENDIALLKLKTEAVYTDYVQPACIWYAQDYGRLPSNDVFGTVVGWGLTESDTLSSSLKRANLPLVPQSTCVQKNPLFYANALSNNKKFCGGWANGTSPCNGDSGGGFVTFVPDIAKDSSPDAVGSWYIRGIVSLAVSIKNLVRCDPYQYVIFTDVEKYNDWINKHLC